MEHNKKNQQLMKEMIKVLNLRILERQQIAQLKIWVCFKMLTLE